MRDPSCFRWLPLLALVSGASCTDGGKTTAESSEPAQAEAVAAFPCVHYAELRRFLPEALEGLTPSRDGGSTGRYGEVSVSEAERLFTQEEGRELKVRIVDTSLGAKLGLAIRAAAEEGRGLEPDDPEAPLFWKEAVGFVRTDGASGRAEANLLVGGRYVVAVTSHGFPGTVEVRRVARGMDLEGLARLHPLPPGAGGSGRP